MCTIFNVCNLLYRSHKDQYTYRQSENSREQGNKNQQGFCSRDAFQRKTSCCIGTVPQCVQVVNTLLHLMLKKQIQNTVHLKWSALRSNAWSFHSNANGVLIWPLSSNLSFFFSICTLAQNFCTWIFNYGFSS